MLLSTFENKAKKLIEIYFDRRNPIYKCKDIFSAMTVIQKVFCSDIQAQELRHIYFDRKLQQNDAHLRVFLHNKMDLYCGYKAIYQIPPRPHKLPKQLYHCLYDFLNDFAETIVAKSDFYKELARKLPKIHDTAMLTSFVDEYEQTMQLMHRRAKSLNPKSHQEKRRRNGQNQNNKNSNGQIRNFQSKGNQGNQNQNQKSHPNQSQNQKSNQNSHQGNPNQKVGNFGNSSQKGKGRGKNFPQKKPFNPKKISPLVPDVAI